MRSAIRDTGVCAGRLVLVVIALTVIYPRVGAWYVRSKVVPRLETKLGRKVAIGGIDISLGHAVLHDVTVRGAGDKDAPLVRLDRVEVTFDTWRSFMASAKIVTVVRDGFSGVKKAALTSVAAALAWISTPAIFPVWSVETGVQ